MYHCHRAAIVKLVTALSLTLVTIAAQSGSTGPAPEPADPEMRALVDAERAFAHLSVEKGMKEAFLANLADESIVFRPGPVPARAWFRDRPASSGILQWEPDFAALARSGDFGYTSGPWQYHDKDATQTIHGHFVTVWRKQADGHWKVMIDAGAAHAPPVGSSEVEWAPRPLDGRVGKPVANQSQALQDGDRALARSIAAQSDWVDTFLQHTSDDVRLYRPGAFPAVGRAAVRAALQATAGTWTWTPMGAGASSAGDLGYTYGTARFHPAGARPDSVLATAYLRLWRQRSDGMHEIVLDVANPMPSPKPQAKP